MLSEINDYYVPTENIDQYAKKMDCGFMIKRLSKEEILEMTDIEKYDNALCQGEAASINEFAYIAMNQGTIASIAGASSNSELLWWVGVDTIKAHRRKGLATALVNKAAVKLSKWIKYRYMLHGIPILHPEEQRFTQAFFRGSLNSDVSDLHSITVLLFDCSIRYAMDSG